MDDELLPKGLNGQLMHFVEECGEVLQVAGKIGRFGWIPTEYKGVKYNNTDDLVREINDLTKAATRLLESIQKTFS